MTLRAAIFFLCCLLASAAVSAYVVRPPSGSISAHESAYDHVLRTKTLRCGYASWPPFVFTTDPITGKISGIFVDVIEAMAKKLSLKVEWAENTGSGGAVESLRTHRIDAFCAGLWVNAERGRYVAYTAPVFYSATYPYVAVNDHRFDKDLSGVNRPETRIATMDGEMSDIVARTQFPRAKPVSIPALAQPSDMLLNVAMHKADIVFTEPSFAAGYMQANPKTLRRAQDKPFQTFATAFAVEIHEHELQTMLDNALTELQNQGVVTEIIAHYAQDPTLFLRIAHPYQ